MKDIMYSFLVMVNCDSGPFKNTGGKIQIRAQAQQKKKTFPVSRVQIRSSFLQRNPF